MVGLALRWQPAEINISAGACSGAFGTAAGFVFSYPAIYILAYSSEYAVASGSRLLTPEYINSIPLLGMAVGASLFSGMLGVIYFIIFRRIWIVADPLPYPGFESSIKLMDIANDISKGARQHARRSINIVAKWTALTMIFTFLRDFPLGKMSPDYVYYNKHYLDVLKEPADASLFDSIFKHQAWYDKGAIMQPHTTDNLTRTHIGFGLFPMQFAIGWFMQFRTALLLSLGTLLSWFVIVPLAVSIDVPIFVVTKNAYYPLSHFWMPGYGATPAIVAGGKIVRTIAIGAILGGGITALLKMAPVFKTAMADVVKLRGQAEGALGFVEGRGWYEWPTSHIPYMVGVVLIGTIMVLALGGINPFHALIFALLLVTVCFFLSAIAVKISGEVRTTPVSGTSFLVLLALVLVFMAMKVGPQETAIIGLLGSTVFGTAVSLSSDISGDFKIGLYCGTRPYHLIKGELTALIPGVVVAGVAASILSLGLARGELGLEAPQANAFATFTQMVVTGHAQYDFLAIGVLIGILAELTTGMGTAFGLGMYLPLHLTLPILFGGSMRTWWEKKRLEPRAKREKWTEREKTFVLLDTYMVATGLIVGEALMGTVIAFWIILS